MSKVDLQNVQVKATCRIIDKDGKVKGEFELTNDDLEVNEEQVKKLIEEKQNASE